MANITLYNDQPASATFVPNIFIDEYMRQANGEYVKIYLYLLRNLNQSAQNVSLSAIADHFDCTERDILRALKYWENCACSVWNLTKNKTWQVSTFWMPKMPQRLRHRQRFRQTTSLKKYLRHQCRKNPIPPI